MTVELKALQQQVKKLEADLTPTGLTDPKLKAEWQDARDAERTASAFEAWLAERVTQVAVGWVLSTVFVRFCEDNRLIEYPFIAGPGERTALARDLQQAFYERHPERGDRDWLKASFDALSVSPVAKALFDEHNPMWSILPSPDQAKALLDFWRQTGEDGELRYDLTDPDWDTRFLGDLYQDLSESAQKTYALLQTPEFVEEFILNYTLNPAMEEFGLEPDPPYGHAKLPHRLRVIDPACGSGHFLLGAFHRLLAAWRTWSPTTDNWVLIENALSSVHGVDKNPFAAAIARFRLMLAAMRAGDIDCLSANVNFSINVAVGDSLIHGYSSSGDQGEFEFEGEKPTFKYRTEDIDDYIKSVRILAYGSYHAVFANPPYITVKDKAEGDHYRALYPSCYREYSLSIPFAERIFKLAIRGSLEGVGAGYTGQITANSFMKQQFGKKLVQEFFTQVDLTHVIDTSGAYIPDHGTPTVILFGRWRYPRPHSTIRAVLGVRGEPGEPEDPSKGFVWRAIVSQVDEPGSESEWISVLDFERKRLAKHPWSVSGGGATELLDLLNSHAGLLGASAGEIGYIGQTNADDAFFADARAFRRRNVKPSVIRRVATGEHVRDFRIAEMGSAIFPYIADKPILSAGDGALRWLWPNRTTLGNRATFSKLTYFAEGRPWFEWHQVAFKRLRDIRSLTYAFVATHNHFVFDRSGQVGNRHAPVIKLPEGATDDDHFSLLGVLNSSTACFWLKQVCHDKGSQGVNEGFKSQEWERFYEFGGTQLEKFPLPSALPPEFGYKLDSLAKQLADVEPSAACARGIPSRDRLDAAHVEHERIRRRMIALQEELDWDVYRRYGLVTDDEATSLVAEPGSVPNIDLGLRAFEIVLARKMTAGEVETQWFARHRSTAVPEIPEEWPQEYRAVVERRIEMIERDRNIGLIERPECKRRWLTDEWEDKEREALKTWLLDRCEERSLWYGPDNEPRPMTVNRLADRLRADNDVVSVARLLAGPDADLSDVLVSIIANEHVPCLARARYKSEGLVKRAIWEQTWKLQREEDRTNQHLDIPAPPKYRSADFIKDSYWRHRGKLDVPKERFISYPYSCPDSDNSMLLGWAGWDHREQAYALIALIEERATTDGWDGRRLTPLIAGLAEVMPWVRQWHHEQNANGQSPAYEYDTYLTAQREKYALPDEVLASWSPSKADRVRCKG